MNKRIFIFSFSKFPRASAGANYIQYMAKSLQKCNWHVVVIAIGANRTEDFDSSSGRYIYRGIEYFNNEHYKGTIREHGGVNTKFMDKVLSDYKFCESDNSIVYTPHYGLLKYLEKWQKPIHIAVCRVEEVQRFQFKLGWFNPKFYFYKKSIRYTYKNIKQTIPISTLIEKNDRIHGCDTLLMPILADPYEFPYVPKISKPQHLNFIYSGMKATVYEDALVPMLKAIASLSNEERNRISLHLTGTRMSVLNMLLRKNSDIFAKLKNSLIVHDWLEYDELIDLYKNMDFLLLPRQDNIITRANFPSKVPELMCYGVIPICTEVGDYTKLYLMDNKSALFLNGCDIETCINAIKKAIYMDEKHYLFMRQECRQLVLDRFSYSKWSGSLDKFIISKNNC